MATNYNPGPGYTQTSGFRTASRPNHNGIDYGAEKGTAIPAAVDGEVWRTGYSDTAGYFVILKHVGADSKEFYTTYFHMQGNKNLPTNVPKVGDQVKAGAKPLPIVKTKKWVVFGGLACRHLHHHGYYYCRRSKLHAASDIQETRESSLCCKAENTL